MPGSMSDLTKIHMSGHIFREVRVQKFKSEFLKVSRLSMMTSMGFDQHNLI